MNGTQISTQLSLGMLNDYQIFDYRIKSSFSFSFVTHLILMDGVCTALPIHTARRRKNDSCRRCEMAIM